jgi:hypothetical protein
LSSIGHPNSRVAWRRASRPHPKRREAVHSGGIEAPVDRLTEQAERLEGPATAAAAQTARERITTNDGLITGHARQESMLLVLPAQAVVERHFLTELLNVFLKKLH